jgi:hypothetical protein
MKKWKSKSAKVVRTPLPPAVRPILGKARRAGLFALYHDDGRLEFISATSGKSVLTWFSGANGRNWTATTGERGRAENPLQALRAAIDQERELLRRQRVRELRKSQV